MPGTHGGQRHPHETLPAAQTRTAWILQFARPRTLPQKLYYRALGWKTQALRRFNVRPAAG